MFFRLFSAFFALFQAKCLQFLKEHTVCTVGTVAHSGTQDHSVGHSGYIGWPTTQAYCQQVRTHWAIGPMCQYVARLPPIATSNRATRCQPLDHIYWRLPHHTCVRGPKDFAYVQCLMRRYAQVLRTAHRRPRCTEGTVRRYVFVLSELIFDQRAARTRERTF